MMRPASNEQRRLLDSLVSQMIPEDDEVAIMSDEIPIDRFFLSDPRFSLDDLESVDCIAARRHQRGTNKLPRMPFEPPWYRVLDTTSVLAICFFSVCSGPLGPEKIIADDPVTGTISMILFPMLCSGPFAYIIAELCSALPEDGGYVVWALSAFGPFMALQVGYWGWLAGIFGRVLRVGLLYDLVAKAAGMSLPGVAEYFVKAGLGIIFAVPSLLGSRVLSRTLLVCMMLCVLLPFGVLTVWGFSEASVVSQDVQTTYKDKSTDWIQLINTLYWSYNGFFWVSTVGGRVRNPARAFPHAIYFTYLLVVMLYLLPMLASYSATRTDWLVLQDKEFVHLASTIGGTVLHVVIVFASACGLAGMYIAQVFCEGYQVSGMAEVGLVPEVLRSQNERYDSPHVSILFSLVVTLLVSIFSFPDLLQIANTFSALVQIAVIFAALWLRHSLPFMPRPAKVPGGMPLIFVVSMLPLVVLGYMIAQTCRRAFPAALCGGLLLVGLLFSARKACSRRGPHVGCFRTKMSPYY
uniref:Amino acid permease/ SLC12A domain-containing protein n=1 Tax=Globisporangium ultimum (strain ATCC 200006 / CBS 805.95 / DAOM BR144) TaxID=431595 RepID=K3WYS8_GLOUD